jgi:hypothetical protein
MKNNIDLGNTEVAAESNTVGIGATGTQNASCVAEICSRRLQALPLH